ncbi:MAG: DinB family protein [Chitinophagaceae bacterium]
MQQPTQRLSGHIEQMPLLFERFTTEERLLKPAPGKWSKQEILGHLIDSAVNNLRRFTEVQFLAQPYILIPYKQDELVQVNYYQQLPVEHLLSLWQGLNRQIVFVVTNMPAEVADYLIVLPSGEQQTISWWLNDYVEHLEHHLQQINA